MFHRFQKRKSISYLQDDLLFERRGCPCRESGLCVGFVFVLGDFFIRFIRQIFITFVVKIRNINVVITECGLEITATATTQAHHRDESDPPHHAQRHCFTFLGKFLPQRWMRKPRQKRGRESLCIPWQDNNGSFRREDRTSRHVPAYRDTGRALAKFFLRYSTVLIRSDRIKILRVVSVQPFAAFRPRGGFSVNIHRGCDVCPHGHGWYR